MAGTNYLYRDSPEHMTYGGILSFMRCIYSHDLQNIDVAISGIPYDGATTNRSGARLGPRAIRAASTQLAELDDFPFGFDLFDYLRVIDYGDCFLDPHHPNTLVPAIETHITKLLQAGVHPISFGGDHFVTYPILRAIAKQHGPVALLHFDAHSDTWDDDGEALNHGTMFLRAKQEGLIKVEHSIQVGIRTYNDKDHGFLILTAPWVHRMGMDATLAQIRQRIGQQPVYLTFDIDCVDPAYAPGTGTPVAGGLSSAQALHLLRALSGLNFVGMDVVEVAPAYDVAENTALLAATLAHDYLCLLAEQKGAQRHTVGLL